MKRKPAKKAAKRKPAKKNGRPRKVFDYERVQGLGAIGCTHQEMAAVFKCAASTIDKAMESDQKFSGAYKDGYSNLKMSLRRKQIAIAMGDVVSSEGKDRVSYVNPTGMLIWLGKNMLDQRDTPEIEIGEPVEWAIRATLRDGRVVILPPGQDPIDAYHDVTKEGK